MPSTYCDCHRCQTGSIPHRRRAAAGDGYNPAHIARGHLAVWIRQHGLLCHLDTVCVCHPCVPVRRAGEHPLLRLVLQPPTDGLLQPGGTFGLLLDFRAAHGTAAAAAAGGSKGGSLQPVCLQVSSTRKTIEIVRPQALSPKPVGSVSWWRVCVQQNTQTCTAERTHAGCRPELQSVAAHAAPKPQSYIPHDYFS